MIPLSAYRRVPAAALLGALLVNFVPAQDTRIGDWLFTLPDNLVVRNVIDGRPQLGFRDTPDNMSATVILVPSEDVKGEDPAAAFAAWAKEGREALSKELGVKDPGEVQETRVANGYQKISWVAAYTDYRDVQWVAILVCLRGERRAGGLMMFTNDRARLQSAAATLDQMLGSASFASLRPADDPALWLRLWIDPTSTPSFRWGEPPELPEGDAGLSGIYASTGLAAAGDPREGITTTKFRYSYYTFFANGSVVRDVPPEGLFSYWHRFWAPHFAGRVGTYRKDGEAVAMVFPRQGSKPLRETLQVRGTDLVAGGRVFRSVACETASLQGTFLRADWQQMGEYYRKGITFRPDHTFEDLGFNSTINIGWWLGGDSYMRDVTAKPGKGRWRVAKNTLELLYDDGRRRRFAFHLYQGEPAKHPRVIVLNGNLLVRVETPK